jgi:TIR domain
LNLNDHRMINAHDRNTPKNRSVCMAHQSGAKPPLELFYSYAHEDERLRDDLDKHLRNLERQGVLSGWHDRRIPAGLEWEGQISHHLEDADLILLLVSSDFISSNYCYDVEVKRAMERHESGAARVIPVVLRPTDWKGAPFAKLQMLPTDAIPVTKWEDRDEAFLDVIRGIRLAADQLLATRYADPKLSLTTSFSAPPLELVQLYTEYFSAVELRRDLGSLFLAFKPRLSETEDEEFRGQVRAAFLEKASHLKLDQLRFRQLLDEEIDERMAGLEASRNLDALVAGHVNAIKARAQELPPSREKPIAALLALIGLDACESLPQLYDAVILLRHLLDGDTVSRIVRQWRKDWQTHLANLACGIFSVPTDIFWSSADFHETIDAVSHYRFQATFFIGGFEEAFREVEAMFVSLLTEDLDARWDQPWGSNNLTWSLYNFWLASRSPDMIAAVIDAIRVFCRWAVKQQTQDGWFLASLDVIEGGASNEHAQTGSFPQPDYRRTALAAVGLLHLPEKDDLRERGLRAARWLASMQRPKGYWTNGPNRQGEPEADLDVTLLAIESLELADAVGYRHAIADGLHWMQQQMSAFGTWDDEGDPFPFATVRALELLARFDSQL